VSFCGYFTTIKLYLSDMGLLIICSLLSLSGYRT
jgi:hypothetical protein